MLCGTCVRLLLTNQLCDRRYWHQTSGHHCLSSQTARQRRHRSGFFLLHTTCKCNTWATYCLPKPFVPLMLRSRTTRSAAVAKFRCSGTVKCWCLLFWFGTFPYCSGTVGLNDTWKKVFFVARRYSHIRILQTHIYTAVITFTHKVSDARSFTTLEIFIRSKKRIHEKRERMTAKRARRRL